MTDAFVIDGLQYCYWDQTYFKQLHTSGIDAVHVTLAYHENSRETLTLLGKWHQYFEQFSEFIQPVYTSDDMVQAKKNKRVGIIFGAQNCSPIEDEINLIAVMKRLGLSIMQLTYNNQSLLASGCYETQDSGLTRFGKQAVAEMNRVGMIIDMSHSAERSTLEAIEHSARPICISHANPFHAHPALRNKSDTVIKQLTESGGLFGFSLYPFHLPDGSHCTLQRFCQMIADVAEMVDVKHLAIGSDLCLNQPQAVLDWMRNGRWSKAKDYGEGSASNAGWPDLLPWFAKPSDMHNIYQGLLDCQFNESEAQGIIGNNWFQFLQAGLSPL